ncbi:MAG: Hsp20/alpha crystallin family protein [Gemmatimonadales bacterium]|jgi:HSP20 family protein
MNGWVANRSFPVSRLHGELDRALDDVVGAFLGDDPWLRRGRQRERSFPAVNIWENEEVLFAEAEVPGLKMEDLEILVAGNELTIKGERGGEEQEGVKYHRRERGTGTFTGVVRLPVEVDVSKVEARLENGVLTIMLPKAASAKSRKISVKALTK